MVAEKFQISGVKIIGRYIFAYAPKQNSPQAEGNYPFPPNRVF